jgi:hypothetical protein
VTLREVQLGFALQQARVQVDGQAVSVTVVPLEDGGVQLTFAEAVTVQQGETLVIEGA